MLAVERKTYFFLKQENKSGNKSGGMEKQINKSGGMEKQINKTDLNQTKSIIFLFSPLSFS